MSTYVSVELVHVTASCCHTEFGMPRSLHDKCKNLGVIFFCPACGNRRYFSKSTVTQQRNEIAKLKRQLARESEAKSKLLTKAKRVSNIHLRMRERVKNGVCPCCNRTFQNLLQHMKTEHPDFGNEKHLSHIRKAYGMTQADLSVELGLSISSVSNFERNKPVSQWVKDQIEAWIRDQGIGES